MANRIAPAVLKELSDSIQHVKGFLSRRDVQFLATAAAFPTSEGSIVELGSYKGKSTILIAKAARLAGPTNFVTVDPMFKGIRGELDRNLEHAGVTDDVTVYEMLSSEFAALWDRPIRFLFHDGANQASIVRRDMADLGKHLSEGAIVAFHDVLNTSGYRAEVFVDEVLNSEHFGPVGFCGSIGWGQYFSDPSMTARYQGQKARFRRRLLRLLPYQGVRVQGIEKVSYKLLRSCLPHRSVGSSKWLRAAA